MNWKRFVPILKVNAANREVYGVMAEEAHDKSGETFDYATSLPYVKAWSQDAMQRTEKADLPVSFGNVRAQHGKVAAGKLTSISFDDASKTIPVIAKIVDDNEWEKVQQGVYTGFSIGGSYVKRWADGATIRYTAKPSEVSIVDNPCMYGATFSMVKADGAVEEKKFTFLDVEENSVEKEAQMDMKQIEALAKSVEKMETELGDLKKMSAENQAHLHGMLIHHSGMGSHLEKMHASCAKMAGAAPAVETDAEKAAKAAELAKAAAAGTGDNAELIAFKAEVAKGFETLTALIAKLSAQPAASTIVTAVPTGETGKAPGAQPAATGARFNHNPDMSKVENTDAAAKELAKALENGVRVDTVRK